MDRETSSRVSSIASAVLQLLRDNPDHNSVSLSREDAQALAGSCLSQDETAGQEPADFVDRLKREREDLAGKVSKLGNFIDRGAPGVEDDHRELLHVQHSAMTSYLKILDMRLSKLNETPIRSRPGVASDPPFEEPVEVGGHDEDRDGPIPFSN